MINNARINDGTRPTKRYDETKIGNYCEGEGRNGLYLTLTPVRYALGPSPKWGGLKEG